MIRTSDLQTEEILPIQIRADLAKNWLDLDFVRIGWLIINDRALKSYHSHKHFLLHFSADMPTCIHIRSLFPRFKLIQILCLQVMHDYLCVTLFYMLLCCNFYSFM